MKNIFHLLNIHKTLFLYLLHSHRWLLSVFLQKAHLQPLRFYLKAVKYCHRTQIHRLLQALKRLRLFQCYSLLLKRLPLLNCLCLVLLFHTHPKSCLNTSTQYQAFLNNKQYHLPPYHKQMQLCRFCNI